MPFDIHDQPEDGLKTVANVPIAAVGEEWKTMTGPLTVTEGDLKSAVAALDDPAIKTPRVKLGHLDPRFTPDGAQGIFDGTPALGKFINLRLGDEGMTLYADAVGVPAWFAKIMPFAYPSRSMEGYWGITTGTGHTHDFVITAVSLLGDELPAIETLDDLQVLFSEDGPDWAKDFDQDKRVAASRGGTMPRTRQIAASVSVEDVRRSFFEDFATEESGRYWWWIRAVYVDPNIVIATDDVEDLWSVPYTMADNAVSFGDPVNVFTQYVETDGGKVAASRVLMQEPAVAVFNKSGGSRPENNPQEGDRVTRIQASVDVGALRTRLGLTEEQLPDDATEEQINEAISGPQPGTGPDPNISENPEQPEPGTPEAGSTSTTGEPESPGAVAPNTPGSIEASKGGDDLVTLDRATLAALQEGAAAGRRVEGEQIKARRATAVDGAIRAGKIPPARRDHYLALMSADEEGTTQILASLEPGLIPVTEEVGSGGDPSEEALSASSYPEEWLSDTERQRIVAAREGKSLNHRVVSEAS